MSKQIERLLALYVSNERSIGKYDPKTGKMHTEYRSLQPEDFDLHLAGRMGVGAVPILDDDNCLWAAIDIDNHDQDDDIPIAPIDQFIRANNLPLVPCRSKSGGVHVYLFLNERIACSRIRDQMARWASDMGYAGSEVFPKQSRLVMTGAKRMLGNWINLPYMMAGDTERYCVRGGKKLDLEQFLDHAEKMRVGKADLTALMLAEHDEAPPCVQKMIGNGIEKGRRNEAMYAAVVYLRKRDGDEYATHAAELNRTMFDVPLGKAELSRTVASAAKPDYKYRCSEEPCKSLCDRALCLKRKFGVTDKELDRVDAQTAMPNFSDLVQVMTDPPRWEITLDAMHRVTNLTTSDLLDFKQIRMAIMDRLLKVVPSLKPPEWDRILTQLMENVRKVEAPEDASPGGVVRDKLRDFVGKLDLSIKGLDTDARKSLLRGMPVIQMYEGQRMVMFRGSDFMQYLKRTRSEDLKGINLWLAVRAMGASHHKLRVGERTINVWSVPAEVFEGGSIEAPSFSSEL